MYGYTDPNTQAMQNMLGQGYMVSGMPWTFFTGGSSGGGGGGGSSASESLINPTTSITPPAININTPPIDLTSITSLVKDIQGTMNNLLTGATNASTSTGSSATATPTASTATTPPSQPTPVSAFQSFMPPAGQIGGTVPQVTIQNQQGVPTPTVSQVSSTFSNVQPGATWYGTNTPIGAATNPGPTIAPRPPTPYAGSTPGSGGNMVGINGTQAQSTPPWPGAWWTGTGWR